MGRNLRQRLLAEIANARETVPILSSIRACRDPGYDKFLEVAVDGRAGVIVTGDADLLALNPFRGVVILSPAPYLDRE
ncbi:MAG: putative toxin-antitoxin system toxin component, PIN family [Terracidiphilus sp.]